MGKEQRKDPRRAISTSGMIYAVSGKPIVGCQLRDISVSGAQLILDREAELPKKFTLILSHQGNVRRACTLAWQFSIMAGVRFAPPPEQQMPPVSPRR